MNPQKMDEITNPWLVAGLAAVAGAAIGATAMYLFDPNRGKVRRARLIDSAASRARRAGKQATAKVEDLFHRSQGLIAEASANFRSGPAADDNLISQRVRSLMGHLTHNAQRVESEVSDGMVALRGVLTEEERRRLVAKVGRIPGVKSVVDCLSCPAAV